MIIRQIPWTTQPPNPADPGNIPGTGSLVDLLWHGAAPAYSNGKKSTVYGNGGRISTLYGEAFVPDGTGDSIEFSGAYSGTGTNYTLAAIAKPTTIGVSRIVVAVGSGAVASGLYLMHSSALGTWCLSKPGGASDISSGVAFTTDWWFISASYTHSTGLIQFCLKNLTTGILYTPTATNASSWVAGDGNAAVGGARFYSSNMFSGPITFALGLRSALPLSYLVSLANNPWQCFSEKDFKIPSTLLGGAYTLNLETGVYSFTGNSATLTKDSKLTLDSGTYAISGSNASLLKGLILEASSGSYSLIGSDASLFYTHLLNASSGSYSVTGSDATLTYTPTSGAYTLNLESGAYVLLGQDVTFVYSGSEVTLKAGSWIRYRIIT